MFYVTHTRMPARYAACQWNVTAQQSGMGSAVTGEPWHLMCCMRDSLPYLVIARAALDGLEKTLELGVEEEGKSVPGNVAGDGGGVAPDQHRNSLDLVHVIIE